MLELANGGGVWARNGLCALCREEHDDTSFTCPICRRSFCAEPCFDVHLIARDALDPKDDIIKYADEHPVVARTAREHR